ncbi:hypothetical protein [Pedobacter sp.]|uniref:hypothetical protein n=1 Tax=Pedobacter sp. TaxID=1411316 RepID=UPI00396C666A
MKKFSDFGIVVTTNSFVGDKMKVSKILNRNIIVHGYKIEKSKHNDGDCLSLQIEVNQTKYVVFTGSVVLMQQIKQVPKENFPFEATIIQEDERFEFI